jgi:hypothetical protein
VVEGAEQDVKDAALRRLLALHALQLADTEPSVAMRNVRAGDYVRLHGTRCYVRQVIDGAPSGSPERSITLKVNYHGPDGAATTFAYAADVRIPLLARTL